MEKALRHGSICLRLQDWDARDSPTVLPDRSHPCQTGSSSPAEPKVFTPHAAASQSAWKRSASHAAWSKVHSDL